MKKIGLLFGIDTKFPLDMLDNINSSGINDVVADEVKIGIMTTELDNSYNVIFDRISDYVPFYKTFLRRARQSGVTVISNCFSNCADDIFNQFVISNGLGIKTPKIALLPSKWLPKNTTPEAMRNLIYPLNWSELFDYVSFPAILRSNNTSSTLHDFKVYNTSEFHSAYELTGANTMILQESIPYDNYFVAFIIGKKFVKIANYSPNKPLHLRFSNEPANISKNQQKRIEEICRLYSTETDFNFNAIEFGIKDNEIYAVEFKTSISSVERHILLDDNYEWIVGNLSKFLIDIAK